MNRWISYIDFNPSMTLICFTSHDFAAQEIDWDFLVVTSYENSLDLYFVFFKNIFGWFLKLFKKLKNVPVYYFRLLLRHEAI